MKILQINNNHYYSGGTEAVYLNTIKLLEERGHKVAALSINNTRNISTKYSKFFITNKNLSHNNFYSFLAKKNISKLIAEDKPDIAHIHNIVGGISFSILPVLKKMGIPIISSIHNYRYLCPAYIFINGKNEICEKCSGGNYYNCIINNCSRESKYKSVLITLESYMREKIFPFQKFIDKFIFVSNFAKNKFVQNYPQIEKRSFQIYNFRKEAMSNVKKKKGNYFLYFGRLEREKGINTLIKSFKNLYNEKLLIIGDGPLRNKLMTNKPPNVELLGYKKGKELEDFICNAHFVIVPSEWYENNPMSIVEAYSFGIPVIGSNLGGIPEIILDGKTGFIFEAKNSVELTSVISNAARLDEETYINFSNNALEFANQNFNSERYSKKLIEIYKQTIEEKFLQMS